MYALPGATVRAQADGFAKGLAATAAIFFRVMDEQGGTVIARTSVGIIEEPAASGVYIATFVAPSALGSYSIVWDDGTIFAADDLFVTGTTSVQVVAAGGFVSVDRNFLTLQEDTIEQAFKPGERTRVKKWINTKYQRLWSSFDWRFKFVPPASITVTAGQETVATLADFGEDRQLYNDRGSPLGYLAPQEFFLYTQADRAAGVQADPGLYTVVDRVIYLSPTPATGAVFKHEYTRRLCHLDNAGNVVAGGMSADSDYPVWPGEHDEVLVVAAKALGLSQRSSLLWDVYDQQANDLVVAMLGDGLLLEPSSRKPALDPL